MHDIVNSWAAQLGMAPRTLFPLTSAFAADHFAMLDGRRGSFALSINGEGPVDLDQSRNWQWSADLAHHVSVSLDEVRVRTGRESQARKFRRESVERELDTFLKYLQSEQSGRLPDLVPFLIDEFLQTWSLLSTADASGTTALAVFLVALHAAGQHDSAILLDRRWRADLAESLQFEPQIVEYLDRLQPSVLTRASSIQDRAPLGLRVVPELVIRHAGGRLFQEAHAYLESAQLGLFGDATVTTNSLVSPTGAYFTPVPVARILTETVLAEWAVLPAELVIADYACGSGVFLVEALHALEERGFSGTLTLVGRDISASAVTMAKAALAAAQAEVSGPMRVVLDVSLGDITGDAPLPVADVILMNPPFRSWERMDKGDQDWVREQLAGLVRGRPDLSVGIIERALSHLAPKGVLGTLIPAGVLASDGMAAWRTSIAERAQPSMVAVLGEHGLFRHALVNVGVLVLKKREHASAQSPAEGLTIAWASAEEGTSSAAIRALRRSIGNPMKGRIDGSAGWSVTRATMKVWRKRPSWLPGPGATGPLMERIESVTTDRVEDLFKVRQAIRTGDNEAFLLSNEQWMALPSRERRYFVDAAVTQSFVDGDIVPGRHLFWPDEQWVSVADLERFVPTYLREYLLPREHSLRERGKIDPNRWWRLTWPRHWTLNGQPRLLGKRFGLYPAFARDLEGRLAPVQANAWLPTERLTSGDDMEEIRGMITAYWWLLNSRVTIGLFREFCPNVAGGQLDMEHKYVRHVPLPDLKRRLSEDVSLQNRAAIIRVEFQSKLPPVAVRDEFAAAAYGTRIEDWRPVLSSM